MIERELIAEALPAYEVGDEIGRGGWGVVFGGRHRQLGRAVAVKQLPRAFSADAAVRERFHAEARTLAGLDHPHIVPVYDYVEHKGLCLLVMEKLPGGSLYSRFSQQRLDHRQTCAVSLAILAALQRAHAAGVLHRDIKPDNVLFGERGSVKVADFGIAKVISGATSALTRTGEVLGTPIYMAPEQIRGHELSQATDLYSLSVLMYELLCGAPPFIAGSDPLSLLYKHLSEEPPPLAEVPDPLADVVLRGLRKAPHDRYDSAEAMAVTISEVTTQLWGVGWIESTGIQLVSATAVHHALARPRATAGPPRTNVAVVETASGTPLLATLEARVRTAISAASRTDLETLLDDPGDRRGLLICGTFASGPIAIAAAHWPTVVELPLRERDGAAVRRLGCALAQASGFDAILAHDIRRAVTDSERLFVETMTGAGSDTMLLLTHTVGVDDAESLSRDRLSELGLNDTALWPGDAPGHSPIATTRVDLTARERAERMRHAILHLRASLRYALDELQLPDTSRAAEVSRSLAIIDSTARATIDREMQRSREVAIEQLSSAVAAIGGHVRATRPSDASWTAMTAALRDELLEAIVSAVTPLCETYTTLDAVIRHRFDQALVSLPTVTADDMMAHAGDGGSRPPRRPPASPCLPVAQAALAVVESWTTVTADTWSPTTVGAPEHLARALNTACAARRAAATRRLHELIGQFTETAAVTLTGFADELAHCLARAVDDQMARLAAMQDAARKLCVDDGGATVWRLVGQLQEVDELLEAIGAYDHG